MERVRPEGSGGDRGGDLGNPGGEFGGFRGTPRHSSHPPRRGSAWSSERSVWCEGGPLGDPLLWMLRCHRQAIRGRLRAIETLLECPRGQPQPMVGQIKQ
ncbi:uncharacterized protein M8220_004538 isoform 3-T3 [Acridotheres tristis]